MQDREEGMRPWDSFPVGAASVAAPAPMPAVEGPPPLVMVVCHQVPDTCPGAGQEQNSWRGAWNFVF